MTIESGNHQQIELAGPERSPLYAQIRALMVSYIVSGKWKPGQMLPSEIALASEFAVSQGTVRKALNELEAQYLVVRRQGRGTFVSEHTPQRSLFHFFHIVDDQGRRELPTSIAIYQRSERAGKRVADKLEMDVRDMVHKIARVRYLRGRAILLERLWLPAKLFPGLKFPIGEEMSEELYVLYQQRYQVVVGRAQEQLRAVAADDLDSKKLGVASGAPLLQVERVAYDLSSRPVELRVDRCNTEHCYYFNQLE